MNIVRILGLIFFILNVCTINSALLKAPPHITAQEIDKHIQETPMEMAFSAQNELENSSWRIQFSLTKNGKPMLNVQCVGLLPPELASQEAAQFLQGTGEAQHVWEFMYNNSEHAKTVSAPEPLEQFEQSMGIVAQPRIVFHEQPTVITSAQCAHLVQGKRVVFYTGAGISANVVPTLPALMESLGITADNMREQTALIKRILQDPDSFIIHMQRFYHACLYGEPTAAHKALAHITHEYDWGLLTENLDLLHQRSGIKPLSCSDGENWIKNNIAIQDLAEIDYVITVGLAEDERGFLNWYKMYNPHGVIIAYNLAHVPYLDSHDFLVVGNAQETVSELELHLKMQSH